MLRNILVLSFFSFLSVACFSQTDSTTTDADISLYGKKDPNKMTMDTSMNKSFGYFFDGNGSKMWNGKDTVPAKDMQEMRDKMNQMAPDFQKFFGNGMTMMPFDGSNGMKGFGGMDSMMQKSFGFFFDGKNMQQFGADSSQMNEMNKLFGNFGGMDLSKLMQGDLFKNFGDRDTDKMPRVAPDNTKTKKKNNIKKDKYDTESL